MTDAQLAGPAAPHPRTGRSRGPPGRAGRLRFAGLGYALVVLLTGTNLATPLYAAYEHVFHLSPLDVTLLVAVYAAAVMVALLACGPLSDTAGYRPVLAAGLVTAAGGAALLAAASGPAWLYAGRAVQGLAVGTCSGALTAGLVLTEPRGRPARASFLAATATTAACGAGPVLAGALAQYAPAPAQPQLSGGDRPAGTGAGRGGRAARRRWAGPAAGGGRAGRGCPARTAACSCGPPWSACWPGRSPTWCWPWCRRTQRPRWAAATCWWTAPRPGRCCWWPRRRRPPAGPGARPGPRPPAWPA